MEIFFNMNRGGLLNTNSLVKVFLHMWHVSTQKNLSEVFYQW